MRIRTIKPEFWTSRKVAELPAETRLLFVGLWSFADDYGYFLDEPAVIRGALFAYDDVPLDEFASRLDQLAGVGMVCRFEVDGKAFAHVTHWKEHQVVSHVARRRLPRCPVHDTPNPPEGLQRVAGESPELSGESPELSGESPKSGLLDLGPRKRDLGPRKTHSVGLEPVPKRRSARSEVSAGADREAVTAVFDAWRVSTGRSDRTVLDAKRLTVIRAALAAYPLPDVVDAVRGWRHSAHHRGENERRTVYNDLGLLLRDAQHIERFRDLERNPKPVANLASATSYLSRRMEEAR